MNFPDYPDPRDFLMKASAHFARDSLCSLTYALHYVRKKC